MTVLNDLIELANQTFSKPNHNYQNVDNKNETSINTNEILRHLKSAETIPIEQTALDLFLHKIYDKYPPYGKCRSPNDSLTEAIFHNKLKWIDSVKQSKHFIVSRHHRTNGIDYQLLKRHYDKYYTIETPTLPRQTFLKIYPIERKEKRIYKQLNLPLIQSVNTTGFELHKDFVIEDNLEILEHYKLIREIGQAAFSTCVEAINLKYPNVINKDLYKQRNKSDNRDHIDNENHIDRGYTRDQQDGPRHINNHNEDHVLNDIEDEHNDIRHHNLSNGRTNIFHREQEKSKSVCLKVIKNENKDYFDQSLDEIKILQKLQESDLHPNIIVMTDCFYYREHLFIVTDLCFCNLYEFQHVMKPSFFSLRFVNFIARQLFDGLNFIHSKGIIHSDIKPENILISSYDLMQIKIIDFGSAFYQTNTEMYYYIQSRNYRSIDVILGVDYLGENLPKIDIWSTACVLFELFTNGTVLFENLGVCPTMLLKIISILGKIPTEVLKASHFYNLYFYGDPSKPYIYSLNDTESFNIYDISNMPENGVLRDIICSEVNGDEKVLKGFYNLLRKCLSYDIRERYSAIDCLNDEFMLM